MRTPAAELWRLGAVELASFIRTKQVASREVVEAHVRRIEAVNPKVNAVTVVLGEQALEAARAADRDTAAGVDLPPLHGVPFTVKGNIDMFGTPTTQGSRFLKHAYPERDAPVVERMRAAGAIPIGQTNLPTFAVRWHTDSELWGPTVNPWDPALTPGASSGGEAAAIATGMSPLGLGNDGLGSLRWPAQCCGVAALKPTLGRIPHASSLPPVDSPLGTQITGVEGPMARRIGDLRTALQIVSGATWRDPWSVPMPVDGPPPEKPVRVAVVADPAGRGVSAQVREGVERAARILEQCGYEVVDEEPPSVDSAATVLLSMLNTPEVRSGWELMSSLAPAATRTFMSSFFAVAGDSDPVATMQSFVVRQTLLRSWGLFQESCPLIVAPISTDVPFVAGRDVTPSEVAGIVIGMRMAMAVNALGLPAVAVPVGVGDGLPQVVQVIGRRYREDMCLDAAAALEDALGTFTPIEPRAERLVAPRPREVNP